MLTCCTTHLFESLIVGLRLLSTPSKRYILSLLIHDLNGKQAMRPLNVLIPVIGLAFFAAFQAIVIVIISTSTSSFASFEYFLLMYIVLSIVAIFAVLRNSRIGFLVAAIVSALLAIF